jgi:hypothetical protein
MAEPPLPAPITCVSASRSMPVARPTTSAWASVCALAAATALLMSLTISPWPTSSPTWTISSPIASNSGRARAKSSGVPPAMIVSVPSCALGLEPVTGASTKPIPRGASVAAMRRLSPGAMVDMSTHRVPSAAPSATP